MTDLALFDIPEPFRADPVTTDVRAHKRRLRTPKVSPVCRVCGIDLAYGGVGRPPVFCDEHRPEHFPERQQLNGALSSMVRAGDPPTSRDAAKLAKLSAGILRAACLFALVESGDLTDFELAEKVGRQQTSAGKRRGELVAEGYVEASGEKRPAPSGALSMVWRATDAGRAKAQELRGT